MNRLIRAFIALGIVGVGAFILMSLVRSKPEPKKEERVDLGTLVEIRVIDERDAQVQVDARGTVVPAREVQISPEVSGRVTWMAPEFVPGGRFAAGATLVRLDARDYKLAVDQQFATVDRAQTELKLEASRKKVAEKEWELFGPDKPAASASGATGDAGQPEERVALREPQMRSARVAVESAKSGLERAKLAVSKTVLRAPFNAMVRQRAVELGQLVGPGTPLASLVGTDAYWVQVSVPIDHLSWLRVPGVGAVGAGQGSPAVITQEIAGKTVSRDGRVVRLLGDVDPAGRMARLLVEIEDPLGLKAASAGTLPLLLGTYVSVSITGEELQKVAVVPRQALREGDKVYLRRKDDTLEIREVGVAWRRENEVLISSGLAAGEEIIVSPIATPVPGLKLRVVEPAAKANAEKAEAATPAGARGEVGTP